MGSLIPHTNAVANGRYLAGLLMWNGLVKSEGLATPSFFLGLIKDYFNLCNDIYINKHPKYDLVAYGYPSSVEILWFVKIMQEL